MCDQHVGGSYGRRARAVARTGPRARVFLLALDMMTIPTPAGLLAVVSCLSLFIIASGLYVKVKQIMRYVRGGISNTDDN